MAGERPHRAEDLAAKGPSLPALTREYLPKGERIACHQPCQTAIAEAHGGMSHKASDFLTPRILRTTPPRTHPPSVGVGASGYWSGLGMLTVWSSLTLKVAVWERLRVSVPVFPIPVQVMCQRLVAVTGYWPGWV